MHTSLCSRLYLALLASSGIGLSVNTPYSWGENYHFVDLYTLQVPNGSVEMTVWAYSHQQLGPGSGFAGSGWIDATEHALFWNASSIPIDLNPLGFSWSRAYGTSGLQQVGDGRADSTNNYCHALLWNSTNSPIDLHPDGFYESWAMGIGGDQQVGQAYSATDCYGHAMLWHGSSAAIDLNPQDCSDSFAFGTDGEFQVGNGYGLLTGYEGHALLWHGTNVAIDLHPANFQSSTAISVSNGQQVGVGQSSVAGNPFHALVWNGTNEAVDLHPIGYEMSEAFATNGVQQVGCGQKDNQLHALLWTGTNTVTDLSVYLPEQFQNYLYCSAYSIDVYGNVYGMAFDADYNWHAVEWAVPEPTSPSVVLLGTLSMLAPRRGNRKGW